ncbi:MAG: hypothetical protein KGD63_03965 [Candidatus Lokiarchaeota archaeon]|nr:hypothetical protein [Candidatus Lokiarchaeota archaeon]
MEKEKYNSKIGLAKLIKRAIELLCEKNFSEVVVLSSYKISSILNDNFGINIKADKIGRFLSNLAKRNDLKRLNTNIPKYKLHISHLTNLKFF